MLESVDADSGGILTFDVVISHWLFEEHLEVR